MHGFALQTGAAPQVGAASPRFFHANQQDRTPRAPVVKDLVATAADCDRKRTQNLISAAISARRRAFKSKTPPNSHWKTTTYGFNRMVLYPQTPRDQREPFATLRV